MPDFLPIRASWEADIPQISIKDKITVRNLQINVNSGLDVWGREKKQRALVTVTLKLKKPFDSAAKSDALDNSTVHYGKLSKDILTHLDQYSGHESTHDLAEEIVDCAKKTVGDTPLHSIDVDIFYPKGSMFGDGAGYWYGRRMCGPLDRQLYLRNIQVPCLIGVNSNERLQKQPVVINLWIECVSEDRSNDYTKLETAVVEVVSGSSFETLESLSTTIVKYLTDNIFVGPEDENSYIRLRIEKPHAVPAADAPEIEIARRVGGPISNTS